MLELYQAQPGVKKPKTASSDSKTGGSGMGAQSQRDALKKAEAEKKKVYQNKSTASETANLESKIIDETVAETVRLINMDIQTLQ